MWVGCQEGTDSECFMMASVSEPECHWWDVGMYLKDVGGCCTKGTGDHLARKPLNLF